MMQRKWRTLTKEEYTKAIHDVIYLCACAVNETIPDRNKTAEMNLEFLYKAAQKHSLTAAVAYALESVGIKDHAFEQAKAKSIRKITLMEFEKNRLFEQLEEKGIWYAPLKGCIVKELYPSIGMRQMSDFDILYDKDHSAELQEIMLSLGFTCEESGKGHQDVYYKQPVCNFEMHTKLFSERHKKEIFEYYRSVKDRLIKNENDRYGYHFNINDFYIYLIAHEYKHYIQGGTGIRSLLDTYILWQKCGHELDHDYIQKECLKMGIDDFEHKNKELALRMFNGKDLTAQDIEMLDYYISSGTYGTLENNLQNSVNNYGGGKKGKRKYIFQKLFMPMDHIKAVYPIVYRHKILLPGLFVYRLCKAITVKRKDTMKKLKILRKAK